MRPGGYLLFVGLEPYESLFGPADAVRRIEALGDAAALLAGSPSYREMPEEWVLRQLHAAGGGASGGGVRVVSSTRFVAELGPRYARSQLDFASQQAAKLGGASDRLRAAFSDRVAAMQPEAARLSAHGRNYAIVVKREK